jgi:hypothetical protein
MYRLILLTLISLLRRRRRERKGKSKYDDDNIRGVECGKKCRGMNNFLSLCLFLLLVVVLVGELSVPRMIKTG